MRSDAATTGSFAASEPGPLEAFKRVRDGWEQDRREGLHDEPEPREDFLPVWDRGDA